MILSNNWLDKLISLTPVAYQILVEQATERSHIGIYNVVEIQGSYLCRRCGLGLFRASSQFDSGCGWPSFDVEIEAAIKKLPDLDEQCVEVRCNRCNSHLGHVFDGEQYTINNRRYCINSASIDFVEDSLVVDTQEAILAGGCFWGVDYYLRQIPGVVKVEVGYTGGSTVEPTYEQVCSGNTGHYEAVRVLYDVTKTNYRCVLKRFFEIHDPTQETGQGPDLGPQYKSTVFFYNKQQRSDAQQLIQELKQNGYDIATRVLKAQTFWAAETYHQNYYAKNSKMPYCHQSVARFEPRKK